MAEVKSNLKLDIANYDLNKRIDLDRVSSSDTIEINVQDSSEEYALKINKEVLKPWIEE